MMYVALALMSIFATYGISYTMVYLDGPFDLIEKFRQTKVIDRLGAFYCVACLSFWVSIPVAFLAQQPYWFVTWIGVWGAVIFLDVFASNRMV